MFDASLIMSSDARLSQKNHGIFILRAGRLATGGAWSLQVVADLPGLVNLETAA